MSLASCAPSEVDDLFDENPAVRIDNAVKNYTELLKSNGGRWLLKYFPNGDQEGYNFVMHFKNGSVEISSKNAYFDFTADESLWDVISDFGPVLTFNTYNEVFHPFSDPEPDGTGLGGDYEFIIMSADENTINLRGKKTGIAAELVRISDATSDLDIFNQIDAQRAISFSSLVDTLYLTTSTGYQFGAIGHNGMVWTFFPDEGNHASNLIDYPEHMNSMFTLNGLRFMGPLDFISEYDPEAFIPQNFTLQEDGTLLAEDGVTRISAGALSKVFCSQRVSFNIDKDNMIYSLEATVCCPCCGNIMKRIFEPRNKIPERWRCERAGCHRIIPISDVDLLSEIQDLFNSIISNPELITPSDSENQISIKTQRAENEINRLFDSRNPNKDQIRGKLIEAVSLKYGDIDTAKYESQWLRDLFLSQAHSKNSPWSYSIKP